MYFDLQMLHANQKASSSEYVAIVIIALRGNALKRIEILKCRSQKIYGSIIAARIFENS